MARPTKLNDAVAATLLDVIASGGGRAFAAERARIGLRTLVNWIARGRAGEPMYAEFATQVDAAEEGYRKLRVGMTHLREAARRRESYQEFKVRRIAWWRERLGETAFFASRCRWLREHGRDAAADRLEAGLMAAGFGVGLTR